MNRGEAHDIAATGRADRIGDPATWGSIAAGATVIASLCITALPNRFIADDYLIGSEMRRRGFLGAVVQDVQATNGRFAGFLTTNLLALFGPRHAALATLAALAALGAAVLSIVTVVRRRCDARAVGASLLLTSALVTSTPIIDQTYYWVSGIGMSAASLVYAVAAASATIRAASSTAGRRWAFVALAMLTGALCSGSYETTGVAAIAALAVVLVMTAGLVPRRAWAPILAAVGGLGAGLVAVRLLPGTALREEAFPATHGLRWAVLAARGPSYDFVLGRLRAVPTVLALVAGLMVGGPRPHLSVRLRTAVAAAASAFVVALCTFSMSRYALGGDPVARTRAIPAFFVASAAFALGACVATRGRKGEALRATVTLVAAVLAVLATRPALVGLPERVAWSRAWDHRDAVLRNAGPGEDVMVPALAYAARGLDDITRDPTNWVNRRMAMYYDVRAVIAQRGSPESPSP